MNRKHALLVGCALVATEIGGFGLLVWYALRLHAIAELLLIVLTASALAAAVFLTPRMMRLVRRAFLGHKV